MLLFTCKVSLVAVVMLHTIVVKPSSNLLVMLEPKSVSIVPPVVIVIMNVQLGLLFHVLMDLPVVMVPVFFLVKVLVIPIHHVVRLVKYQLTVLVDTTPQFVVKKHLLALPPVPPPPLPPPLPLVKGLAIPIHHVWLLVK